MTGMDITLSDFKTKSRVGTKPKMDWPLSFLC
jgi:hypothetical protein